MLPCQSCSAPRFEFSLHNDDILDAIPSNSLSAELGTSVRKVTQRIKQLNQTSHNSHDGDIGTIDYAIQELSQNIQDLNAFRTQRLALAASLRARIPYIHMLPPDILQRIFLFSGFFYSPGSSNVTLYIASVCRRWRETVGKIPWRWTDLPRIDVANARSDHLRLFKSWLKMSQEEPLKWSLAFTNVRPPSQGLRDAYSSSSSDDIMALIDEEKPRVHYTALTIAGHGIDKLHLLGTTDFGVLTSLGLSIRPKGYQDSSFPLIPALHNSPKLYKLQLRGSRQPALPDPPSLVRLLPWHQITMLHCQYYLSTGRPGPPPPSGTVPQKHYFRHRTFTSIFPCLRSLGRNKQLFRNSHS